MVIPKRTHHLIRLKRPSLTRGPLQHGQTFDFATKTKETRAPTIQNLTMAQMCVDQDFQVFPRYENLPSCKSTRVEVPFS